MPSEIGYPLPPNTQRPQLFNRVELEESKNLLKVTEDDQLSSLGVEQSRDKVVTATREVLDDRFPSEGQVERFRGNTEGRNLREVPASLPLTRLPSRVQAFNPLTARSDALSSLSIAESAATGLTPVRVPVNTGLTSEGAQQVSINRQSTSGRLSGPAINGSGEIAARFEAIEERLRQRALDEFEELRPGGSQSEQISFERDNDERRDQDIVREVIRREVNQESALISTRNTERQNNEAQYEARVLEERDIETSVFNLTQNQQVLAQESPNVTATSPIAVEPGELTDSRGQALSSQEQKEVKRVIRAEQEIRAFELAQTGSGRARGPQSKMSVQGFGDRSTDNTGGRIAPSTDFIPQESTAQAQGAKLSPIEFSGADRELNSLSGRDILDPQDRVQVIQEFDEELKIERSIKEDANQRVEAERAGEVELRENLDHFAGAQAVHADPSFAPKSEESKQSSLEARDGIHPLSTPEESPRPVTGPAKKLSIEEQNPSSASPRSESPSPEYERALDRAMGRA
jgi:hypothetical protein